MTKQLVIGLLLFSAVGIIYIYTFDGSPLQEVTTQGNTQENNQENNNKISATSSISSPATIGTKASKKKQAKTITNNIITDADKAVINELDEFIQKGNTENTVQKITELTEMQKQARIQDDRKYFDQKTMQLNNLAIIARMTTEERTEYYKSRNIENDVMLEIKNDNAFTDSSNEEDRRQKVLRERQEAIGRL